MTKQELRNWLNAQAEPDYQKFSSSLIPGCEPMLGIRIPVLRKKAKEIAKGDWRGFLEEYGITATKAEGQERETANLDGAEYFEEKQLQAMVLGYRKAKTEEEARELIRFCAVFVPRIGNWSVNDTFCTGLVLSRAYPDLVWDFLMGYRTSTQEFEQRVVAVTLMSHYLKDGYIDQVLDVLKTLQHDGYYQRMGVAWALATAYAKYPKQTMALLQEGTLSEWVYQKAIQKMLESYRVPAEDKKVLRAMKQRARQGSI